MKLVYINIGLALANIIVDIARGNAPAALGWLVAIIYMGAFVWAERGARA
jgi:hypothetical protein